MIRYKVGDEVWTPEGRGLITNVLPNWGRDRADEPTGETYYYVPSSNPGTPTEYWPARSLSKLDAGPRELWKFITRATRQETSWANGASFNWGGICVLDAPAALSIWIHNLVLITGVRHENGVNWSISWRPD